MATPMAAPGHMGVDYEQRVDFARLRDYRLGRAGESLEASECGAFLLFDFYNIRYTTHTWIGGALGDKMIRYALLARGKEPVLWDFGSAVKHHQQYSQWVPSENYRAGFLGFRGAVAPTVGLMADAVAEIKSLLVRRAWPTCPSASTSSNRRSCSRCSVRACGWWMPSSSCSTPG